MMWSLIGLTAGVGGGGTTGPTELVVGPVSRVHPVESHGRVSPKSSTASISVTQPTAVIRVHKEKTAVAPDDNQALVNGRC